MTALPTPDTTFLVQLTDTHIREPGRLAYGRIDTAPCLRRAVAGVRALRQRPDAVVVTGDLSDFGRPAEYAHLAELLAPLGDLPVYLMPGNHDDRDALRRGFPGHGYLGAPGSGPIQYSAPVGGLRLIALDTSTPGQPHGELCAERLAWLADELDRWAGRPVVIALHHPPFDTLIGHMDRIGLREGAPALEALVRRHPNVERLISGHLHRAIEVRFGGSIACTAPGPAHQVALDLQPGAPSQWVAEATGFRVFALPRGGRMVSHLAALGEAEGPYPFHDAGGLID
jgi:3',5'-cyclic AMP phosphodiesterase CpdA